MDLAKIQLSQEELSLVQNADWLLTKNRIIKKVYAMFGGLATDLQKSITTKKFLPAEVFASSPKISKGENYLGLPYVMLDYPRHFGKDNVFAIRTMFWWGNFFSVTLHIKGSYKNELLPILERNLRMFAEHRFFVGINPDEWRHDFDTDNYIPIDGSDASNVKEHLYKKEFCKIANKIDLKNWNDISSRLSRSHEIILKGIDINFRAGETNL